MSRHKVQCGPKPGVVEAILVKSIRTLLVRVIRTSPHIHPSLWMGWVEDSLYEAYDQCHKQGCDGVTIPVPSRNPGGVRLECTKC